MNNILKNLLLEIIIESVILIVGLIFIIKERHNIKYVVMILIIISLFLGFLIGTSIPFYKDLRYKETVTYEGVCVASYSGISNLPFGCTKRLFDTDGNGKHDNYFWDSFLHGNKYVCEDGQRYRVTFYKHSHTIYSLEKIE